MKELSNALDAVVDWCTLGIKLGLETAELRRIENDYPHNNAECKSEMLASCLRSDHPPSWKVVVDALCWMGEHLSACKIWRKYLKSMKGTSPQSGFNFRSVVMFLSVVSYRIIAIMTNSVKIWCLPRLKYSLNYMQLTCSCYYFTTD